MVVGASDARGEAWGSGAVSGAGSGAGSGRREPPTPVHRQRVGAEDGAEGLLPQAHCQVQPRQPSRKGVRHRIESAAGACASAGASAAIDIITAAAAAAIAISISFIINSSSPSRSCRRRSPRHQQLGQGRGAPHQPLRDRSHTAQQGR